MPEPPALLLDGARDVIEDLTRAIENREHDLASVYLEVFTRYREELQLAFLQHSLVPEPTPTEPGEEPQPIRRQWAGMAVSRATVLQPLLDSFQALLDALYEQSTDIFDEMLAATAEDGFERELWFLAEAGLDVDPYWDAMPEDWSALVEADTLGGVGWDARLLMWNALTAQKVRRWLSATTLSGATWEDTLMGLSALTNEHTDHVLGLLESEVFRAFAMGSAVALLAAERDHGRIRELWISRLLWGDLSVCSICKAKHLTITADRPIHDSHPGCRCIKVPFPDGFSATPVPYTTFLGER